MNPLGRGLSAKCQRAFPHRTLMEKQKATAPHPSILQYGSWPSSVRIVEVGARDGIQNEKKILSTEVKIELINRLVKCGLKYVEATAFVSPKWVPQMADSTEVMAGIERHEDVIYSVLAPNLQGFNKAVEAEADEVSIFTAASEAFCKKNTNCTIAESLERFQPIVEAANRRNIRVRGSISCVFADPYTGPVQPVQVADVACKLYEMGCDEILLGDTTGVGTPGATYQLVTEISKHIPISQIAVHFHDTYGQALSNILAALQLGVNIIDSSVGGFGGCPYAKGATGNVATENVVYMLEGLGIKTGVNLKELIATGQWLGKHLGKAPNSNVNTALSAIEMEL